MAAGLSIRAVAVTALLAGTALLAAGCEERAEYDTVGVTTPEFAVDGPILTMRQWRHSVGEVCHEASAETKAVSSELAERISAADPGPRDEAAITLMAFEASRPVIEEQLARLAELRPPTEIEDEYHEFVATLTAELRWSGRIAQMVGEEGVEDELLAADQSLAAAAVEVSGFVRAQRLRGCLPALKGPG